MLRPIAASLAVLLVVAIPTGAVVAGILELVPTGFPYLGGVCGIGVRVNQIDLSAGINCGNARTNGDTESCGHVNGGTSCNITFKAYGQVFRWINSGSIVAELYDAIGPCHDEKSASWQDLGALTPLTMPLSCTEHFFVPPGQCVYMKIYATANFTGALSPPPWTFGPEDSRLCD